MKKLKTILQHNIFYVFIIILSLFIVLFFTKIKVYKSEYKLSDTYFSCIVQNIEFDNKYAKLKLRCKEKLTGFYYFKTETDKKVFKNNVSFGDKIYLNGKLIIPSSNTNPNLFNYKKYLYYNKEYYTLSIDSYEILNKNSNVFYKAKSFFFEKLGDNTKSNQYIKAFLLGDDNYIEEDLTDTYRKLGISHLFSVSGMHISLIMSFIAFILKKIKLKESLSLIVIVLFLFFYMLLVDFTPSVLRSGILFLIIKINNFFKLELKTMQCFIISVFINVLINPFICYKIGFIYSAVISFYLILFSDLINKRKSYFYRLFVTSFIAWLVSIPISIYNFFEINFLSVFYNMIFVPFISIVIFPFSFFTFIFDFLNPIFELLINIFEYFAVLFIKIDSNLVLRKPIFLIVIVHFIIITFILYGLRHNRVKGIVFFIIVMMIHYNYNSLFRNDYLIMLDVGQGDSLMLHSNNKTFLIDTGGHSNNIKNEKIVNDTISILKSFGIRKIDYLFITHGDYDHMGGAINLVNNFKVEKVIFNCGEYNDLEKELIKILNKIKIKYYSCIKELNINDNKLYFLNNKDYGNENDNSSVIYTELNNHKFLFMGDAGVEVEEDIIEKYNLHDIEVLKVGHHGSKTSSGKEFIEEINPKYSIISVGNNNRYGHPNKEVLNNLGDSTVYRTDRDGSIMFKIKNNKLKIEICAP